MITIAQVPQVALRVMATALMLALTATAVNAAEPGWHTFTIPGTGSYATWYLPQDLDLDNPVPAIVFLHGSGAYPHHYSDYVEDAASTAGCVLILPKSAILAGWGETDDPYIVGEAIRRVTEEIEIDPWRISVAGHSSGGAYACWLAYATVSHFSAVFSLSAPFLHIQAIADPDHTAPIRMYYGTDDPNYFGGSHAAYLSQWSRLDVSWEEEILTGFGHNTWPDSVMENGFTFLVQHVAGHRIRPGERSFDALEPTTTEGD